MWLVVTSISTGWLSLRYKCIHESLQCWCCTVHSNTFPGGTFVKRVWFVWLWGGVEMCPTSSVSLLVCFKVVRCKVSHLQTHQLQALTHYPPLSCPCSCGEALKTGSMISAHCSFFWTVPSCSWWCRASTASFHPPTAQNIVYILPSRWAHHSPFSWCRQAFWKHRPAYIARIPMVVRTSSLNAHTCTYAVSIQHGVRRDGTEGHTPRTLLPTKRRLQVASDTEWWLEMICQTRRIDNVSCYEIMLKVPCHIAWSPLHSDRRRVDFLCPTNSWGCRRTRERVNY